jgi:ABC-type multidrug transport system fused ATPase/permease subunit
MVQNFTLLVAAFAISFSLQWKMALVVVATFPLVVSATIIEVN